MTLTIWYQIDQCHFAYTCGKPGSVLKTMQSFDSNKHSQPATNCRLIEGKVSISIFSPSSLSFNDNAIVSNFYTKKFYALFEAFQRLATNLKGICI